VLGQTRFVEIERLCLQYSTVLPTERVGVGRGERGHQLVSQMLNTTTAINEGPYATERGTSSVTVNLRLGTFCAAQQRARGRRWSLDWTTHFWIKVDQLYLIKIFCAGLRHDSYSGV
jgi:hypothetical protein